MVAQVQGTGRLVMTLRLLIAMGLLLVTLSAIGVAQGAAGNAPGDTPQSLPAAGAGGRRLILKDGSWQEITQYEVRGERARYFSPARGEWEELPKNLVDWKATEDWNARLKETSPELRELKAEEEADGAETARITVALTVAPGLTLPAAGGVFVLDRFGGEPSLDELAQSGSELNNAERHNRLHSPLDRKATIKQQLNLKGARARVQAHVRSPEIFVRIVEDASVEKAASTAASAEKQTDRFRIVRLEPKEDFRVLMRVEVSVLGKQNQEEQFVPVRVESFHDEWVKVVPLGALEPGEYALVEMLGVAEFNSYVWDFGIDPAAPENANARKAKASPDDEGGGPEFDTRQE